MYVSVCMCSAQSADRQFAQPDCTIWRFLLLHTFFFVSLCTQLLCVPVDLFLLLTLIFHPYYLIVGENVYW